jgi:hypothetical protein
MVPAANAAPDSSLALGDFNQDGNLDIALEENPGYPAKDMLLTYLGHGDGTFQSSQSYALPSAYSFVSLGDFNGDGKPDLATIAPPNSQILFGHGDSAGTFTPTAMSGFPGSYAQIASGNFSGSAKDGFFFLGTTGEGVITTLLSHGDGSFETVDTPFNQKHSVASFAIGDFNGDGKLDAVLVENSSDSKGGPPFYLHTLLGHDNGSFLAEPIVTYGAFPGSQLVSGDFNGDGVDDLVGLLSQTQLSILTMQGYSVASAGLTGFTLPATDEIVATYNGDDLFTASTSGSIAVGP